MTPTRRIGSCLRAASCPDPGPGVQPTFVVSDRPVLLGRVSVAEATVKIARLTGRPG